MSIIYLGVLLLLMLRCLVQCDEEIKCPPEGLVWYEGPAESWQNGYFNRCQDGQLVSLICQEIYQLNSWSYPCKQLDAGESPKSKVQSKITNDEDESFSTTVTSATTTVGSTEAPFQCPSDATGDFPDKKNCKRYIHCENGNSTIVTCPAYHLFDVYQSKCIFFWVVHCSQEYTPSVSSPTHSLPTAPPCATDVVTDYPDETDCKKYYHCDHGIRTRKSCSWYKLFDADQLKCRFFIVAMFHCKTSSSEIQPSLTAIIRSKRSLSANVDPQSMHLVRLGTAEESNILEEGSTATEKPLCIDGTRKPYPGSCIKYNECTKGKWVTYYCFFTLRFDKEKLKCLWFMEVDCKKQITTTTIVHTSTTMFLTTGTPSISTTIVIPNSTTTIMTPNSTTTIMTPNSTTTTTPPPEDDTNEDLSNSSLYDNLLSENSNKHLYSHKEGIDYNGSDNIKDDKWTWVSTEEFSCRPTGVYNAVYPGNCRKYYHCQNGVLTVEKCFWFRDFDPIKLKCRWFWLVNCHPVTTTTTTTTESTTLLTEYSSVFLDYSTDTDYTMDTDPTTDSDGV